jgi:hypothetical protein
MADERQPRRRCPGSVSQLTRLVRAAEPCLEPDLRRNANLRQYVAVMTLNGPKAVPGPVTERRRAVALARHYREFEGLSNAQIAHRLGRSPTTVKAYFYDPTGEKARAGEAPLRRGVPRLRGVHPAAQGQGRRVRVLQELPPGRDRAALDVRAGIGCDARLAGPLRAIALVL